MAKQKTPSKTSKKKPLSAPAAAPSKLVVNFRRIIEQLVQSRNYHPLSLAEFMQKFQLPPQHTEPFNEALDSLIADNLLHLEKGRYALKKQSVPTITGIIRMHVRGFGFVKPDEPTEYTEDIFIPKHLTMNAIDGDSVEIAVNTESQSDKGPEGKVTAVLSRNRTHVAGVILSKSLYGGIEAFVPLLGLNRRIVVHETDGFTLRQGDRVVMKVLDWGSREGETTCEVTRLIGHISDPSCDVKAAIEEFGLRSKFSTKALKEAESCGTQASRKEISQREDIRDLECVTIDPDTAKDFDDAITLTKTKKGQYRLGVHIADVSHYVPEGSALDKEAALRCNSTYFPGVCIPMLPPTLSENLCSLKPDVNRLTISVFVDFDSNGNMTNYRIARTVIRSAKRFTYRQAKDVLDGKLRSKHAPLLHRMVELCRLLKLKRYERGSIEFSLPDLWIKIDEQGVPTSTEYIAYDVTHQMIEEFMLKANEIVAYHLSKLGKGVAYRVHDEPSSENMKDFSALASAFGFNLKENCSTRELQEFFDEALQTPFGQYLATSYIKRMRQALYSPENIGHYGLGLTHYCHFTSPIRRYVDLVVHRTLFDESTSHRTLEAITQDCSEQERISAKAENSVILLKKLRLLAQYQKDNPNRQYECVVTRVKQFGFSFDVLEFLLEGFFHVAELDSDYYIFEESGMRLRGRHTGKTFCAGDRVTIMLKEVDYLRLESKWHLVGTVEERSNKKLSSKAPKGKSRSKSSSSRKGLSVRKGPKKSSGKPRGRRTK